MTTTVAPRHVPGPISAPRRPRRVWDLPVGREWLIAILMVLLPIERVLVLQVGVFTVRPVFALMAIILVRELALRDWPWAVSRPAQQLMQATLIGVAGIIAGLVAGVWPYVSFGYCLWIIFTALFFVAMVRTITVRADLDRWARWAVSAASLWSIVTLLQWLLAASVLPSLAYSFLGPLPRVHALTFEPSYLALYLLPHLFLAHQTGRKRALATISLALVLSTSRLGLIGLVAGILATGLLHRRRRRRTLALAGTLSVALGILASLMVVAGIGTDYTKLVTQAFNSREQSSASPRLETWYQAQSLAGDNMPFGVGPGGYGDAIHARGEDLNLPADQVKTTNLWLEVLAEMGVPGLLAIAGWTLLPLVRIRKRTDNGVNAGLFLGGAAVMAVFPLFQTWQRPYMWVWWGLIWAAAVMPAHGRPAPRRPRRFRRYGGWKGWWVRRTTRTRIERVREAGRSEYGQAGMALAGRLVATGASVVLTVVTARALGPTDRGVLVLAILVGFLVSIAARGATQALAYELALVGRGEAGGAPAGIIADSWRVSGLLTLVAGVPAFAIAAGVGWVEGWGPEGLFVIGATVLASLAVSTPTGFALADGRMGRWALLTCGYTVGAVSGALLALGIAGADLGAVCLGWAVGAVAGAVLTIDGHAMDALWSRRRARSVGRQARFAIKSSGSLLLTTTANRADVLLLGVLSTTTAVGLYSVAIGASELVWFAGEALATAAYGRIGASRRRAAARSTLQLCALSLVVAAVQAALLALVAHDAMALVFGEQFRVSGDFLQILLIGTVLGASVIPVSNYLSNQVGRPLLALALAVVILTVTAAVAVALIPGHGATGAAIASTSGYGAGMVAAFGMLAATWRAARPRERDGDDGG